MECLGVNLEYFKEQITEELDGACCYAKMAIELKAMNSSWSRMLIEMSVDELDHADKLFKMFDEYCSLISKPYSNVPETITKTHKKVTDMFAEKSAKVKYMHDLYSR